MQQSHAHRFALPRWLSRSGHKPSLTSRVWFVIVIPLLALLLLNGLIAARYEGLIYPGVSVAGVDLTGLTQRQAYSKIEGIPRSRQYVIKVGDKEFSATSQSLGANYDIAQTVSLAYSAGRNTGLPMLGIFSANNAGQLGYVYSLDYKQLKKFTTSVVSSVGQVAQNASVSIENGQIVVNSDENGVQVDRLEIVQSLGQSLTLGSDATLVFQPKVVTASIKADDTKPAQEKIAQLLTRKISLTYEGRSSSPSAVDVGHWIKTSPNREIKANSLNVEIDETQVRGWVQSVANSINKNPINKKVTVSNGLTSTDREGVDGLVMLQDSAADQVTTAMRDNQDATIAILTKPVSFKTETTQTHSIGQGKYIEINLSQQHLWAYENGQVVYSSAVTSGAAGAGLGTVTGTFAIYYKTTNTYLNGRPYGYNYNVFVKYWMPFYLGYGLHDANWRSSFGGPDYYYGGSHGCVNLPDATAAFIYNWSEIGTTVWVHT